MTTLEALDVAQPAGTPWLRRAELVDVSFPDRTIELIVIPYEREAEVRHPNTKDRMVTEIISRGAFDGIERRASRIKGYRDHDERRLFGRAAALYPGHEMGLKAKLRVSQTLLGDETLQLAEDGCLDASAGFLPMSHGGMSWETRSRYRVNKAWLHHIALVSDGAYGEDAGVLAVRAQARPAETERRPTPNLAALELRRWRDEYERIDARWR